MCSVLIVAEENGRAHDADAKEDAHAKTSSTLLNSDLEIFYLVVSVFHGDDGHDHSRTRTWRHHHRLTVAVFLRIDSRAGRLSKSFITSLPTFNKLPWLRKQLRQR